MKIFQIPTEGKIVIAVETGKVMYRIATVKDVAAAKNAVAGIEKGIAFESFVDAIKGRLPVINRRMMNDGSVVFA